jgi:hypothetical protein
MIVGLETDRTKTPNGTKNRLHFENKSQIIEQKHNLFVQKANKVKGEHFQFETIID